MTDRDCGGNCGEDCACLNDANELMARQNELYIAMGVVEEMPAGVAQTTAILKLSVRMRLLVERLGRSETGRPLDV